MFEGKSHNAKACTIDGRDYWVASLRDERGSIVAVMGCETDEEAKAWLRAESRRRGVRLHMKEVR